MCYTRGEKDRDLETEARRVAENRLMEEERRQRFEEHERRRAQGDKPSAEKVGEMVGAK